MIRKTIAGLTAAAAVAGSVALAAPAQADEPDTILDLVGAADRFTSSENAAGLDRFRWDQRNWYDFDILTAAVVANSGGDPASPVLGAVTNPAAALTLFAPNDRAFQLLAYDLTGKWSFTEQGVLNAIVGAVGTGTSLTKVLTYHVVGAKVVKADVPLDIPVPTLNGGETVTISGNKFGIQVKDNVDAIRNPYLVNTDIGADTSMSVIHSISRVLVPSNLP